MEPVGILNDPGVRDALLVQPGPPGFQLFPGCHMESELVQPDPSRIDRSTPPVLGCVRNPNIIDGDALIVNGPNSS
jgi:hypothetical protein